MSDQNKTRQDIQSSSLTGGKERQEYVHKITHTWLFLTDCIIGIAKGFYQFTGQIEELDRVIWTGKCINEKVL